MFTAYYSSCSFQESLSTCAINKISFSQHCWGTPTRCCGFSTKAFMPSPIPSVQSSNSILNLTDLVDRQKQRSDHHTEDHARRSNVLLQASPNTTQKTNQGINRIYNAEEEKRRVSHKHHYCHQHKKLSKETHPVTTAKAPVKTARTPVTPAAIAAQTSMIAAT